MNIDRERAKHALEIVERLEKEGTIKKYVSYVKSLPATILQNGLGQAMATLLAASKGDDDDHKRLYLHIEEWLCKKNKHSPYCGSDLSIKNGKPNLMQAITHHNEPEYIQAQAEAMAYLEWLKKFAVAYLSDPEESGGGREG